MPLSPTPGRITPVAHTHLSHLHLSAHQPYIYILLSSFPLTHLSVTCTPVTSHLSLHHPQLLCPHLPLPFLHTNSCQLRTFNPTTFTNTDHLPHTCTQQHLLSHTTCTPTHLSPIHLSHPCIFYPHLSPLPHLHPYCLSPPHLHSPKHINDTCQFPHNCTPPTHLHSPTPVTPRPQYRGLYSKGMNTFTEFN